MLLFQEGTALSIQAQPTPTATLSPFERLAEPTLPSSPQQADYGAQSYWLLCLPCHGDRGQGLTDEFRETYPPEEQYCWERGCHGERPYEDGFKLPMKVPAVVGPDATLGKFSTAAGLHAYIKAAMPYWNPGSLTEEESWVITAFLLRENGIPFNGELNDSTAGQILFSPIQILPTPTPLQEPIAENTKQSSKSVEPWMLALAVFVVVIVVMVIQLRKWLAE